MAQARRVAMAAQGFSDPAPRAAVTSRHLRRVVQRTGLLQIDSVNVLQRAHYMPIYSRLGPYDTALLDKASYRRPRWLFEYWGHEASLLPVALHPLMRWRMASADRIWGGPLNVSKNRPDLVKWVLDEVTAKGPVTAAEIERDVPGKKDHWGWNWSDTKKALEYLFYSGAISAAGRTSQFARRYDIAERVIPREILDEPTPSTADAHRHLVELAASRLGVAGEVELRDYFRLPVAGARAAIGELVEAGVLLPVEVDGWSGRTWIHRDITVPRQVAASTLLSPFDPLIWERKRTERLFNLHYRIEIYTPPHKRIHGYYVLPFLHGDRFVARVDLKADRRAGVLRVPAAWAEAGINKAEIGAALQAELFRLADWLGLSDVAPPEAGDLARFVKRGKRS